ncbi:MAG: carboxypeptidase-like regulatory domain-containing protein [Enhygromyxa sp.]
MFLVFAIWAAVSWWRGVAPGDRELSGDTSAIAEPQKTSWIRQVARDELPLRLKTRPWLTGTVVVAPSLELSAEITVCASSAAFAYDSVTCVTVDPDGRFRIPASQLLGLQGRTCQVGASAPGARPAKAVRTKCEGELPQPLVLDRAGHSITGTVVDHFGGPVVGARVFGDLRSATGAAMAVTNDAGSFELWTGNGRLFVSASGYGSVRSHGPLPDSDRRIELYPEAAIEGTVWESEGTARQGVHVELRSRVVGAQVTTSDADGRFRFSGLGPGDFELRAIDGRRGAGPEPLRVPMGETLVHDLTLEPRAVLHGKIGFASGAECTDVSLVRLVGTGTTSKLSIETQQVGADAAQYRIAGLAVGTYRLVAACSEAALDVNATVEVSAAEDITYDVVFEERSASIFGYVEGVTEPAEWIVTARRASSDPKADVDPGYRMGMVTAAGEFTVTELGEGAWILDVFDPRAGEINLRDGPGTEVVVEQDDVTDVRLSPADQQMLQLTVVRQGGEAVKGQRAGVHRAGQLVRRCMTGDDGSCEVGLPGDPPYGELIFFAAQRILCNGQWRRTCPMSPEGGAAKLVVEDVTSLSGRLTDARDGAGVGFAQISAILFEDDFEYPLATTRTEEDGSFVLSGLPADDGSLSLKVTCPAGQRPPIYLPFGSTPSVACDDAP